MNRLSSLPGAPNRLQRYDSAAGYVVLDDTFNANPAGAGVALSALAGEAATGRRVLVTPGMVELGSTQHIENAAFAESAAGVVTDIVVVGRTNRSALLEGASHGERPPRVQLVGTREEAVAWARANLGAGRRRVVRERSPGPFPLRLAA